MSKIATVEAIPVSYPEPNDFNALRHLCLAKITSDDGQVGWGESITQFPEASYATREIINGMAELALGQDPLHVEAIYRSLKDRVVVRLWRRNRFIRHLSDRHRPLGFER